MITTINILCRPSRFYYAQKTLSAWSRGTYLAEVESRNAVVVVQQDVNGVQGPGALG